MQRDVAPTALDLADKRPVQATGVGKLFLALAEDVPLGADSFAEEDRLASPSELLRRSGARTAVIRPCER